MKILSLIAMAAMMTGSVTAPAFAQNAQLPARSSDYYALAPSARGQFTEERGFNDSQIAPTPDSPSYDELQRFRGGRW